jgi:tetratricopeptide (TPR) repeat protein
MEARSGAPRGLLLAVLGAVLVVLLLGGAVIAVKLRTPPAAPGSQGAEVTQWQQQVAANPNSDYAETGLGVALQNAGQLAAAQRAFEAAVALNPKNWFASFQLGVMISGTDPAKADRLLTTAGALAPSGQKVGALTALGDLRLSQKDYKGAIVAYTKAVADDPMVIEPHTGLAQAYAATGRTALAISEIKAALQYDPSNPTLKSALKNLEAGKPISSAASPGSPSP